MTQATNPTSAVRITWHFQIESEDMGAISLDAKDGRINLLFATADKADAFYKKYSSVSNELDGCVYKVCRALDQRKLYISATSESFISALCALHDTIRLTELNTAVDPYKFVWIKA